MQQRTSELSVVRWRKYGKDRLFINGPDDRRLGWRDLTTGTIAVNDEHDRPAVHAAVEAWRTGAPTAMDVPTPALVAPAMPRVGEQPPPVGSERPAEAATWEDLAQRRAGQAAREQAMALKQAAPVRTFLARVLRVHTDEWAWRIGADGEEKVAALARLIENDPRWRVLHAVPVGKNGSDIDHVVVGPAGVFTLNAKHHPGARIWVAGTTFMVNGQKQPYLRNSRHEAARAAKLLTAASGVPVQAFGVVVAVGARDIVIKTAPEGAHASTAGPSPSGWDGSRNCSSRTPSTASSRRLDGRRRGCDESHTAPRAGRSVGGVVGLDVHHHRDRPHVADGAGGPAPRPGRRPYPRRYEENTRRCRSRCPSHGRWLLRAVHIGLPGA